MENTFYLSLGANLGAQGETLREAIRRLSVLPRTQLVAVSSFYRTAPWGKKDQPDFLNAACSLRTSLEPLELLHACQELEQQLGRVRHEHWGARTCDIDLLCTNHHLVMDTDELKLPHPYLTERAFVLVPLAEIAPRLKIDGRTAAVWRDSMVQQDYRLSDELSEPYPLSLIACIGADRGIGKDGQLLFDEPEDKAFFREKTMGGVVIMGRRTMAQLPDGAPLPWRTNIILSRTLADEAAVDLRARGFLLCGDIMSLWQKLGQLQSRAEKPRKLWVIGGESIYQLLLPYCREAWVTEVAAQRPADCFLPELTGMELRERQACPEQPQLTFCRYGRPAAGC